TARLYAGYLHEAIWLSLAGLGAIGLLLMVVLRSPVRVLRVLAPLLASVLVVVAALAVSGKQLTILHLVGMLLIVAVGSNYALFFDRGAGGSNAGEACAATHSDAAGARMLASLLCANLTTVAGFGLLSFSTVPVLQAIGITVGPGAILALAFSAILAGQSRRAR
ncbi:MAG: MMPL family transporter, partial [Betaproteobacteria bacterium]